MTGERGEKQRRGSDARAKALASADARRSRPVDREVDDGDSGVRERGSMPSPSRRLSRPSLDALVAIGELLLDAGTTRSAFDELVAIMRTAIPLRTVAILSEGAGGEPLRWSANDDAAGLEKACLIVRAAGAYFFTGGPLADLSAAIGAMDGDASSWIALPIVRDDATIASVMVVETTPDDEAVAFVASAVRSLAHVGSAGTSSGPTSAADVSADPAGVLRQVTGLLLSSLQYRTTLETFARIVGTQLGAACLVDLTEHGAIGRLAGFAPGHDAEALERALRATVAGVINGGVSLLATAPPRGNLRAENDPHATPTVASAARSALDVDWLVSVPLSEGGHVIGALTLLGDGPPHVQSRPPVALGLALELGRRAGSAIGNGRRYEAALAAVRAKDEVLTTVSHDLKNPLGVILMSTERILANAPEMQAVESRQIEAIERAARRMRSLVLDVLDVTALEGGALSMRPRAVDLQAVVSQAFDATRSYADAAGVTLVDRTTPLPRVWVDADRIVQVLVNLVGNAINFTRRGGNVTVASDVVADDVVLSITDTGMGIPADQVEHVFERFWRGPGRTTKGSGLGLAICKSIVELSNGRIWVESEVGIGTRVTLALPGAR